MLCRKFVQCTHSTNHSGSLQQRQVGSLQEVHVASVHAGGVVIDIYMNVVPLKERVHVVGTCSVHAGGW